MIIPEMSLGFAAKPVLSELLRKESILYSLGIGCSQSAQSAKDLEFTYELHPNFKVFPTFATCFHKVDLFSLLRSCPGIPKFSPVNIIHGEQRLEILRKIQPGMKIETVGRVSNLQDKVKHALINLEFDSYETDQSGEKQLSFVNTMVLVLQGYGGFSKQNPINNARCKSLNQIPKCPNRVPDAIVKERTNQNQAILYRLSGDPNPLHIDPNACFEANFEKPILHGLCTYGIAAKIAMQTFLDNSPELVRSYDCRFTSHVFPGETIEFSFWKNQNSIQISGTTLERAKQVVLGVIGLNTFKEPTI